MFSNRSITLKWTLLETYNGFLFMLLFINVKTIKYHHEILSDFEIIKIIILVKKHLSLDVIFFILLCKSQTFKVVFANILLKQTFLYI